MAYSQPRETEPPRLLWLVALWGCIVAGAVRAWGWRNVQVDAPSGARSAE